MIFGEYPFKAESSQKLLKEV